MIDADLVLIDGHLITCEGTANDCGLIRDGALAIQGETIVWLGPSAQFVNHVKANQITDLNGKFVTPGLIDCHSHLIFAGNRAGEWQQRLAGASYEQIAKSGGGILSTVKATRAATSEQLFDSAKSRINYLVRQGVTTVEVKSGYGLETETELKLLNVATELNDRLPIDVVRTFLGAHTVPPEFSGRADDYIEHVCREMLPAVKHNCDAVDIFCERIAFNLLQTKRLLESACELGLPIKIHAEQLSLMGGAAAAAELGAISADHLEYLDEPGVRAMKDAGTVAVLLPGAFYFLGETQKPPVNWFREYQVPLAVATDFNPGSSPVASLLLMMNMACTMFGLTVEEAICAVTLNAAKALGLNDRGKLAVGNLADLTIWDVQSIAEIPYGIGHNPCHQVFKRGVAVVHDQN